MKRHGWGYGRAPTLPHKKYDRQGATAVLIENGIGGGNNAAAGQATTVSLISIRKSQRFYFGYCQPGDFANHYHIMQFGCVNDILTVAPRVDNGKRNQS
ncbi:MAG: hypothetical protein HND44_16910 [Chloroflexi bacterium]|nr:hypothetical protein [Chloroflexota bacterium]NOG36225.1 hypothetical protein [Chloroflexota bacterium]GIK58166.1 MAG: hypothetical protein BroJett015_38290 [Chloroflexota bacterium]